MADQVSHDNGEFSGSESGKNTPESHFRSSFGSESGKNAPESHFGAAFGSESGKNTPESHFKTGKYPPTPVFPPVLFH